MFSKKNSLIVVLSFNLIISQAIFAANNHYLPLKTDPFFELELEKLATVARMPIITKPYHLATIQQHLESIRESHPELYRRIKSYISRYREDKNITQLSTEISFSSYKNKTLANARGRTSDSNTKAHIAGFWQLSNNWNLSLGGTLYDTKDTQRGDGFVPHNTYISFSHEYFQVDFGYKELWLSPLQESAMLLSTHAEPIARFSINSPTPLTDWKIQYGFSVGELEEMEGIWFDGERYNGQPGFLTMYLSTQFNEWWTVGANRSMMFGGGERKISLSDVWIAVIDPVAGDNCGGQSSLQDCNKEVGNQQASITNKFDLYWGTPLSIYFELAGEDTNNFSNYALGNKAFSIGIFLPYLTDNSSFLAEIQYVENEWYTHHLYAEGYRNNLHTMGHWWGDEKYLDDKIGSQIISLRYNTLLRDNLHLEASYKTIFNDPAAGGEGLHNTYLYQRAHELQLSLDQLEKKSSWRYQLHLGNTTLGDDFLRLTTSYRWK